ncbi:hypothetical protein F5X97DRAFT_339639 [Nemania serpens]|nr:hypothetical protein F5X97DRAFT_339639 [Nemania serpens]
MYGQETATDAPRSPRILQESHDFQRAHYPGHTSARIPPYHNHHNHLYQYPFPQSQQPHWKYSNGYAPNSHPSKFQSQYHTQAHQWDQHDKENNHNYHHYGGPEGHLRFAPHQTEHRIIQVGEGTTVAGESTDDFADRPRFPCERTQGARLEFIRMPPGAIDACEEFQTFLVWWMDKVDLGVEESIERRARDRVLEMREDIPETARRNLV